MSTSNNLSTNCSGLLLRSSFAILAARTRHLISAARMAALSVASRRSNSSDIILRASSEPPPPPSVAPVARTRFKTLIYLKAFGARVRRQGRGCARSYSDHPRPADDVRAHVAAEQSAIPRGKRQDLASEAEPRRRLPLLFPHVQLHLSSRDYGG